MTTSSSLTDACSVASAPTAGASVSAGFSHMVDREMRCAEQERCNKIGDRAGAKRAYERQRAAVMAMLAIEVRNGA